jgi:hypothetical protein
VTLVTPIQPITLILYGIKAIFEACGKSTKVRNLFEVLGAVEGHMHALSAAAEQAAGFSLPGESASHPPQGTNYQTNPNTPSSKEPGEDAIPDCPD